MADPKVLQIIPASGWNALFEDEDSVPVVCFALVQDVDEDGNATTAVRPMACIDDVIELCDEYDSYLGVARDDSDEYDEEDEEEDDEEE